MTNLQIKIKEKNMMLTNMKQNMEGSLSSKQANQENICDYYQNIPMVIETV